MHFSRRLILYDHFKISSLHVLLQKFILYRKEVESAENPGAGKRLVLMAQNSFNYLTPYTHLEAYNAEESFCQKLHDTLLAFEKMCNKVVQAEYHSTEEWTRLSVRFVTSTCASLSSFLQIVMTHWHENEVTHFASLKDAAFDNWVNEEKFLRLLAVAVNTSKETNEELTTDTERHVTLPSHYLALYCSAVEVCISLI